MYCLRFGSLRYPQRHGLCSLTLRQHMLEGGADAEIAGMHAFISMGLQVAAFAVCASLKSTIMTTTMAQRAALFIFKFFNHTRAHRERERERERERGFFNHTRAHRERERERGSLPLWCIRILPGLISCDLHGWWAERSAGQTGHFKWDPKSHALDELCANIIIGFMKKLVSISKKRLKTNSSCKPGFKPRTVDLMADGQDLARRQTNIEFFVQQVAR